MLKLLVQTLLGFFLFFGSIVFGYFFLQYPEAGWYSILFIVLTTLCLICSAVSMLMAAKGIDAYLRKGNNQPAYNDPSIVTTSLEGTLKKHNFIVSQWRKTVQMRDQMKLLRI